MSNQCFITRRGGGSLNKSVIIVKAPTGSTVTCTKGGVVKRATEKNGEWRFNGLDIGTWTLRAEMSGQQPATQNFEIKEFGVYRVTLTFRVTPEFTYTGSYAIVDDNGSQISDFANWKGNWKWRFLTSGTLTITNMYGWNGYVDVFMVGGGGAGGKGVTPDNGTHIGCGGAGGYTITKKRIQLSVGTPYPIVIGSGGSTGNNGGNTTAFSFSAGGGGVGKASNSGGGAGNGGSGGGDMAPGGSDGSDGGGSSGNEGKGQISMPGPNGETGNTREFGEPGGALYAGGGGSSRWGTTTPGDNKGYPGGAGGGGEGGFSNTYKGVDGIQNSGSGGGGSAYNNTTGVGAGGSGIVIARNAR